MTQGTGIGAKNKPRRAWTEGRRKCQLEGECRACGAVCFALHPHHIVYRSHRGTNDERNCLPVCFDCHRAVHLHRIDVGPLLTDRERAHVIEQVGEWRANELLHRASRNGRAAA